MSSPDPDRSFLYRDGTSQDGRGLLALRPEFAPVDERGPAEWLAFLQSYATRLQYYNLNDEVEGDWSGLFGVDSTSGQLAELAEFLERPEDFPEARFRDWRRPHFALLLAFLKMLEPVRERINSFTRRHLDYYYHDVLGFRARPAGSGRVHVLIEPELGAQPFLLPPGTLLAAGDKVHYQTDAPLVVTQARVRQCRSLFLQRTIIGLDQVRRSPEVLAPLLPLPPAWQHEASVPDKVFLALMQIAVGHPVPGGYIPPFAFDSVGDRPGSVAPDKAHFASLDRLLRFISQPAGLALSSAAFRRLMSFRRSLQLADAGTAGLWAKVNDNLQSAGRRRRKDPSFAFQPRREDDFVPNLKAALNFSDAEYSKLYSTLPNVDSVYGLARHAEDPQVRQFITGTLSFASVEEFTAMMTIVDGFYQRWQRLLEMLREAGRRKQRFDSSHRIDPPNLRDPDPNNDLWERLLRGTIGDYAATPQWRELLQSPYDHALANLDDLDAILELVEQSYFMSVADFATVRATVADPETKQWQWDQVYVILNKARLAKETATRRGELSILRLGRSDNREILNRMAEVALGELDPEKPPSGPVLPLGKMFADLDPTADARYIQDHIYLSPGEVKMVQQKAAVATFSDWDFVVTTLDQARTRKRPWQPPRLEFQAWDNLYAAPDATAVQAAAAAADSARWHPFGDGPRLDGATAPAPFGFMISSPLLALAEGTRTITLTLEFTKTSASHQDAAVQAELSEPVKPFRCLLSTKEEPFEVAPGDADIAWSIGNANMGGDGPAPSLRFTIRLREQAPPIATPPTGSPAPCLQIRLRDIAKSDHPNTPLVKRYEAFRPLVLARVRLEVSVAGLTNLLLQNDESDLDPKKPFEPFGRAPLVGSRFLLAHPEICTKQLSRLEIGFDWLGLPDDFAIWYAGYGSNVDSRTFTAQVKLYDDRAYWSIKPAQLFILEKSTINQDAKAAPGSLLTVNGDDLKKAYPGYDAAPEAGVAADPLASDRFWVLELGKPDFLHSIYPQQAAKQAGKQVLNPPYTPRVRRLVVNYAAGVDLDPKDNGPGAPDQLFRLEPFGFAYINIDRGSKPEEVTPDAGSWLPQYDWEGQLFIGLDGLAAPQELTLLFQMAPGSGNPDVTPWPIFWSYLSGNSWVDLDNGRLLSDTTRGLLDSGVVRLDLPPAAPSTLMPGGLYWLRLATARNTRAVCDVVDIRTQAVTASLAPDSSSASGLALAPNAITRLVLPQPRVKAVHQPFSPFAGTPPEEISRFAIRVSERLRHKGRAVTCWDYERLILEAFPEIHKVKCLPIDTSDDPSHPAVQVIVIPDIRGKLPFDPFEPKVPADILCRIEEFLARRCAAGAGFRVRNPRYCSLRLRFSVHLEPGCNPGFYVPQLNEDLCRFLSPWAYNDSADIVFGSRVNANAIVYFLEQRPYVDYVSDLKLFLMLDERTVTTTADQVLDLTPIMEAAPDIVIVSAAQHQIDLISGEKYTKTSFVGIGYMKIGLDFSVTNTSESTPDPGA